MDIYDYIDDNLSAVARACGHLSYRQSGKPEGGSGAVSCSDCRHWNGHGCSKNQFDSIASEMRLD